MDTNKVHFTNTVTNGLFTTFHCSTNIGRWMFSLRCAMTAKCRQFKPRPRQGTAFYGMAFERQRIGSCKYLMVQS